MAYIVMAYILWPIYLWPSVTRRRSRGAMYIYISMAYIAMACIVMAYVFMALGNETTTEAGNVPEHV